jgi:capping protein alpha
MVDKFRVSEINSVKFGGFSQFSLHLPMSKKKEKHLRIITAFLTNAPPGEFEQCVADLEVLTGSKSLVDSAKEAAYEAWVHKRYHVAAVNGNNVIICDESKVSNRIYLNPVTLGTVKFDPAARTFVATPDKPISATPQRVQLQKIFGEYARAAYRSNAAVGVYDGGKGASLVVIRSTSVSLKNYRTGSIISKYRIESNGKLSGTLEVIQHYFESGNVMSSQSTKMEAEQPLPDLNQLVLKVRDFENQWLRNYLEAFDWLFAEGMAKLRRKIPISGTKINWEAELRGTAGMAT